MKGSYINPEFYLNLKYEDGEEQIKKTGGFKLTQIREGEKLPIYDESTLYVIVKDGIITKIARHPKVYLG